MFGSNNASSAENQQERLNATVQPWYISGFVDGEGSFHVAFCHRKDLTHNWSIIPEFHVSQNASRNSVLYELMDYFGCGQIKQNHRFRSNDLSYVWVVRRREDLQNKIIPFFEKYPLRTSKNADFQIFSRIVKMMGKSVHQTESGFAEIIELAFQMNENAKRRKLTKAELLQRESSETTC